MKTCQIITNKYYSLLVSTMLMWGLSWPVAKILVSSGPPMLIGFLRFFSASIIFIIASLYMKRKWNWMQIKYHLPWFGLLGLLGIFGYGFFFLVGLQFTSAAQGAIIAGINPAMVTIFSILFNKEKLSRKWQYLGLVISFFGVIFVIGISALINYHPEYLIGNILIFVAMICWGLYSALGAKLMRNIDPFISTSFAVYFGAIFFGIAALFENRFSDLFEYQIDFYLGILYLGWVVTFLGFFFYFTAISNIGSTKSGIFINLVPLFGTIFSYFLLNEKIHWTFIIGLILIVSGIILINMSQPKSQR